MSNVTRRLDPAPRLHLPRRTARLRLSTLYSGLFLVFGAALVAVTYALFERVTAFKPPRLPSIPHGSALGNLTFPAAPGLPAAVARTLPKLNVVKEQLARDYNLLTLPSNPLAHGKELLARDEHQLTSAVSKLAHAVHQLAQAGTLEAAQRTADSHRLLVTSGIALAIVTVLALVAGWFVAGRLLRPIRTITRTAQRISSTNLHERLDLPGPDDELKELGDTLDELFGRLDAAFDAQRHFVANASHELRTPLTVERTLLQVALDDPDTSLATWRSTAVQVLASSDEQTRLIEALLALASGESGMDAHKTIDLGAIVASMLGAIRPDADRLGIRIDDDIAPAVIQGDPLLIKRLVANLLDNAVRHNMVNGQITVGTKGEGGSTEFIVANSGPRIAPSEVDRLFQPFQRLDPRRAHYEDGHGLGLSIVQAIADSHEASIMADAVPEGGLSVRVIFPPAGR
ncbi:MAG: ATP-binding protein [Acidimicrobiales bacterium]|jgi:signal transduction histidine kinase